MADANGTAANGGKPQRSWSGNVRARGVRILLDMTKPVLYDRGDESGHATKARVREILQHGKHFTFVLEVDNDMERGRLIGERCLHLSALAVLFETALQATFKVEERPDVVVGMWDPFNLRILMPQRLFLESDLEPEEPVHAPTEEADAGTDPGTTP